MTRFRLRSRALLPLALVFAACSGDDDETREEGVRFDATPRRHIFAPPAGEVRAVPPHAIRSAGVGPYLLGATLEEILGILPHGPRVELLQIQGLVDYSLVRIEADALVIGVERFEGVTFVAVLDSEIARTEEGVGVGTREAELREALGPVATDARRARDPRVLAFESLPNTQFVVEDDRVAAAIVRDEPEGSAAAKSAAASGACADPGAERQRDADAAPADAASLESAPRDAIASAARIAPHRRSEMRVQPGCFDAPNEGLVVTAGERLALVESSSDELRLRGDLQIEGLVHASPIRLGKEGRDAIAAIASHRSAEELEIEIAVIEVGEGELSIADRRVPYRLSARWATWVGAELGETELLVEARVSGEAAAKTLELGGLYVQREGRGTRNVAPLETDTWAPALGSGRPGAERPAGEKEEGGAAKERGSGGEELGEGGEAERDSGAEAGDAGAPPGRGDGGP